MLYLLECSGALPRNIWTDSSVCLRHMPVCSGGSAYSEVATFEKESKVQRWLWKSQSKMVITFTATLIKPTFGPIELAWGVFIFIGFFVYMYLFWLESSVSVAASSADGAPFRAACCSFLCSSIILAGLTPVTTCSCQCTEPM